MPSAVARGARSMPSFWTYYLAWTLLAYALREPWLLAGVAVFLVLRRFIPNPGALLRALARGRALRAQVAVNPANVTARRDLANLYLDVLRPRAALALIEAALARNPDDAELLYLAGLALQRAGQNEAALAPLVRAVELEPRIRFGEPFLVAGDALSALDRHEEAVDAYERYIDANSSDVAGYVKLARAHARLGQRPEAIKELAEGLATWHSLPAWRKRHAFFRGYVAAFWTRVWWLRQPAAIAFLLVFVALMGGLVLAAYPLIGGPSAFP
jgi:tetratricopeptide (TPR) repeat protein